MHSPPWRAGALRAAGRAGGCGVVRGDDFGDAPGTTRRTRSTAARPPRVPGTPASRPEAGQDRQDARHQAGYPALLTSLIASERCRRACPEDEQRPWRRADRRAAAGDPAAAPAPGPGSVRVRRPGLGRRPSVRHRKACPRGAVPRAGRRAGPAGGRPAADHDPVAADGAAVGRDAGYRAGDRPRGPGDRLAPRDGRRRRRARGAGGSGRRRTGCPVGRLSPPHPRDGRAGQGGVRCQVARAAADRGVVAVAARVDGRGRLPAR